VIPKGNADATLIGTMDDIYHLPEVGQVRYSRYMEGIYLVPSWPIVYPHNEICNREERPGTVFTLCPHSYFCKCFSRLLPIHTFVSHPLFSSFSDHQRFLRSNYLWLMHDTIAVALVPFQPRSGRREGGQGKKQLYSTHGKGFGAEKYVSNH
jgi:hypothetical protein